MPPGQANSFLPILLVAAGACAVIVADMLAPLSRSRRVSGLTALAAVLAALAALLADMGAGVFHGLNYRFSGMLAYDTVSTFLTLVFLCGAAAVILFALRSGETAAYRQGEFYALLLGAVLGAILLVTANHLVLFVLGIETLSMCSYVLAGFLKDDRNSAEASLKYLIYGAVVSGILFFGLSYLYGLSGTLEVKQIGVNMAARVQSGETGLVFLYALGALLLAGLGFKMALVPFHFWCPDVYQGAPTPITAFLSVVSKAAGFGALLRLILPFYAVFSTVAPLQSGVFGMGGLPLAMGALALVTMTYGNLAALRQTNVKRLMAYSSIAHAGYLLMPLSVNSPQAVEAILFYFFVYLFMNLGVFWVIIVLINRTGSAEIDNFRGVAAKAPHLFLALFIFLIALTGLPPTAGFVGKFFLFKVVVSAGIAHMVEGQFTFTAACYIFLAVAGVLNSAISLYYYMKLARAMAFEKPDSDAPLGEDGLDRTLAMAFAAPTLALLFFSPVLYLIQLAGT